MTFLARSPHDWSKPIMVDHECDDCGTKPGHECSVCGWVEEHDNPAKLHQKHVTHIVAGEKMHARHTTHFANTGVHLDEE